MGSRIKSETIYRIDHLPGEEIEIEGDLEGKQSFNEYDESGHLILEIAFTRDGDIADKIEYKFDAEGKMLETRIYGEDDEILERKEMRWADDNRLKQEIIHYLDGSEDIHEFFYDEKGNLTGLQVRDDEDEIEFSEKYLYDGDKVVKVERWNGDNKLVFKQEDEYKDGGLTTRTTWSAEDEEPFTVVQHFNTRGHREEELRYNSDEQLVERNLFEEDENGRVVRMLEENKQRKNTTEFSYDEEGRVTYQKETDMHGELNHELYRYYDTDGQPVKTTVEMVLKPSGNKRAYTMVYQRQYH
jgi:hypothetical protein